MQGAPEAAQRQVKQCLEQYINRAEQLQPGGAGASPAPDTSRDAALARELADEAPTNPHSTPRPDTSRDAQLARELAGGGTSGSLSAIRGRIVELLSAHNPVGL